MVMSRADKSAAVSELTGDFKKSVVSVIADYRGLTVMQMTTLRRNLRKAGCKAKVVKNTLARLSVKSATAGGAESEVTRFLDTLTGPSFVVFSDSDPIAPTKVLVDFATTKGNEKFRVKGCWLDGAFVDPAGVTELSKMPGRLETLAMLLNLISAPATRLARVMNESGTCVARVVEAQRKKLGGEG
jgi:large subunit ribosomal protein L10